MISKEDLKKITKLAAQEAWSGEHRTTVNDMIEFIVYRVFEQVIDHFETLEKDLEELDDLVATLVADKQKPKVTRKAA